VWHSSVGARGMNLGPSTLAAQARKVLYGVGDASLGEWEQWTGRAFHLRRRLSAEEADRVGEVIDVRGTEEAQRRLRPVAHLLPPGWSEDADEQEVLR
jgi:hypothetical protein